MKTKNDVILEVLNAQVLSLIQKDLETKKGYGDRFMKAARIVLAGGVKAIGGGKYEVKSGTQADVTYTVNGVCDCEDAKNWVKKQKGEEVRSFAPEGRCKHRLAVTFEKTKEGKLKALVDNRYPHPHTWDCDEHRDEGVTCWQMQCPDPTVLPCPVCSAVNPNVPPHIEQVIAEEGVPTEPYIVHPDDTIDPTTGEILEDAPMITTIGETIIGVMNGLNGTHKPEAVADAQEPTELVELPPLVTEQYEPAPILTPKPMPLPEAPVSLCLTIRLPENHQITYTMRGTEDAAVLERLPVVLATLERLMHTEVDYEGNFIQRLVRAFFPKKTSSYTGK